MSILIKGMKMPKNCYDCEFRQSGYPDWCDLSITSRDVYNTSIRQKWCPLIELHDHGNLIDRDKLIYELGEEDEDLSTYHTLLYAPVVIPAERSNDGET